MNKLFFFLSTLRGWLFLVIIVCSGLSAWADDYCDFTINNIHYKFIPNTTNEVAVSYREYESGRYGGYYSNYTGSVTIPAAVSYNSVTYKVTAILSGAFIGRNTLTSVYLPNTITSIGNNAFGDCSQLYSVNIPSSVTSIGASAFNGCVSLGSINIPNGITSIQSNTFANCQSLRSITIPNSVTSIGSSAFQNCSNLSTISIPAKIESVGDNAFYGTAWLSNLPDGLTYVGKVAYKYKGTMPTDTDITLKDGTLAIATAAFSGCSGLRSINIPESVTSIGPSAFNGCTSLTAITIPKSVISMGGNGTTTSFYGCSALKDVTILCPNVGVGWFKNMNSIENVTLGNLVTNINSNAFYYCNGITSVTIPKSVTNIENQAFAYCTNLNSVSILNNQVHIGSSAFDGTPWLENQQDGMIYIGQIAYKYKGTMPEGTQLVIKEGTVEIAAEALYSCNNMVSISIPNTVKIIGTRAFYGCTGLTSVDIPNSVTSIGSSAFQNCKGLTSVIIANGVTTIGSSAFQNCTGLTSMNIPSSVETIGSSAFYGCAGLTSIDISNSVQSIGSSAFQNCTSLASVALSGNLNDIESGLFCNCTNLTSISIPNSVKRIEQNAFSYCKGLISVDIPNSVSSIGSCAFQGCVGLTSVNLSKSLSNIDYYTFQGCSGLTSITIPSNVTSVSPYAFQDCSITSVTAEGTTPAEVEAYAFSYSYVSYANNITLYVPTGSKSKYEAAPVWKDCKEIIEIVIPTDISGMTDAVYAQPTSAYQGRNTTLPICMKNSESITALQFEASLPNGVTISKCQLTDRKGDDHAASYRKLANGNYQVTVFSGSKVVFSGTEGTVLNLTLKVDENMTAGDYPISLKNIELTTAATKAINPADVTAKFTVSDVMIADVDRNGKVSITDAVAVVSHILGEDIDGFVAAAADVDGNGRITITDAVAIVDMILEGTASARSLIIVEEDVLDPQ